MNCQLERFVEATASFASSTSSVTPHGCDGICPEWDRIISPLAHVIRRHYPEALMDDLELLFSLGADPNMKDSVTGDTPLMHWGIALYNNWWESGKLVPLDTLRLLLEKGANPLIKNKDGLDVNHYLRWWRHSTCALPNPLPAAYLEELNSILSSIAQKK